MKKLICTGLVLIALTLACAAAEKAAAVDQKTQDAIVGMEKQLWEAWKSKDTKPFEQNISDDGVGIGMAGKTVASKTEIVNDIKTSDCDVRSYSFGETHAYSIGKDAVLLVYKADQDATCGANKVPSSIYASSVWVKRGGKWQNFSHQEAPAGGPSAEPKPQ